MATEQKSKKTDTALSDAMKNPLAEVSKESDVANIISKDNSNNLNPNQISPMLDKFENSLIHKKVFKNNS